MKSGKLEARIVKADCGCATSNITQVELLPLTRPGTQPQIKGECEYQVIFE